MTLILSGTDGLSDVDGSAATPAIRGTDANTGMFFPAADTVAIATSGTQRFTVNSSGNIQTVGTISVGNATPSSSGAGITFPATQSASSDANTLDDYEEGTFTPTLASGFSVAPTSYSTQLGRYTKIGRLVFIEVDIDPNGATANATNLFFSGLPFVSAGSPYGAITIGFQGAFDTNLGDTLLIDLGAVSVTIFTNAGGVRQGNAANVNINARIVFSGCYVV
jgi:hypothetical protein